jgi:glycopeptide antibiotics resistance protein
MMESCKPSNRKIAVAVVYMSLILMTSVIPMDRDIEGLRFLIELKPLVQNLLHIPMFAILAILWLQISKQYEIEGKKRIVLILLLSFGFGILNELIQLTIPGRYAGILDMGLNTIGVLCGIALYVLLEKSKPGLLRKIVCE